MTRFRLLFFQELFYENRHYHEHCFRCFRCDRSLADEPFTSQDDGLVCSDCYCNEFSSKCVACDKTVMPGRDSAGRLYRVFLLQTSAADCSNSELIVRVHALE